MLYAQVMQADGASYRNILLTHARGTTISRRILESAKGVALSPRPPETPRAGYEFAESVIRRRLIQFGLSETRPSSALAVELLPFDTARDVEARDVGGDQSAQPDPLGTQLGSRRILRTSPLTAVPAVC